MNLPDDLEQDCLSFVKNGGYIYLRIGERHDKVKYLAIVERRFGNTWKQYVAEGSDLVRTLRRGLGEVGYLPSAPEDDTEPSGTEWEKTLEGREHFGKADPPKKRAPLRRPVKS
jgi:hypothetical protein